MTDLNEIFAPLSAAMPGLSRAEQRMALALYRQLMRGEPVRHEQLATVLDLPIREVVDALERPALRWLVFYDDEQRVVGFGGLAVVEMPHRFTIQGRTLYTWCAWDGLFLPEILSEVAEIESTCPLTKQPIRLTVGPDGVRAVEPQDTVVSFLLPDPREFEQTTMETIRGFCHHVYFLASPEAGERWTAQHEGTFVLTLDEAVALARMNNAARFDKVLGEIRQSGAV
jgi:alkylmercury lyase